MLCKDYNAREGASLMMGYALSVTDLHLYVERRRGNYTNF